MTVIPRTTAARGRTLGVVLLISFLPLAAHAVPAQKSNPLPRDPRASTPWALEPAIATGPDGSIWIAARRCSVVDRGGVCSSSPDVSSGAPVWRSHNGGQSYHFAGDALRAVDSNDVAVASAAGSSVDIAIGQLPRGGTPALVTVLASGPAHSWLSISADEGHTWRTAILPDITARDRPSIASSFACDLFIATRPSGSGPGSITRVTRYDGCQTYDQSQAIARPQSVALAGGTSDPTTRGASYPAQIDAARGIIYVAFISCSSPTSAACTAPEDRQTVRVAISRNRGVSFTETAIPATTMRAPLSPTASRLSIAADDLGNVVVAAWDGANIRTWTSRDEGARWSLLRALVNGGLKWRYAGPPTVSVFGKRIGLAWYGSPTTKTSTQSWFLVVARSTNAGARFNTVTFPTRLAATPARTHLSDALGDPPSALLARSGAVVVAYAQSCDGHPASDKACPGAAEETIADDVIRYGWVR